MVCFKANFRKEIKYYLYLILFLNIDGYTYSGAIILKGTVTPVFISTLTPVFVKLVQNAPGQDAETPAANGHHLVHT